VIELRIGGAIEQEEDFTSRLLQSISDRFNQARFGGLVWSSKVLTSKGHGAQERIIGADFMSVLSMQHPDMRFTKGFLAQAKFVRGKAVIDDRLREQCRRMLNVSADSFVFVYLADAVRVAGALAVAGAGPRSTLQGVYTVDIVEFFGLHLRCLIGDQAIRDATPETLDELARAAEMAIPRFGLALVASPSG